jgi:hypothetical protein
VTGITIAVITFVGQAATTTERAELATAMTTLRQLAEPHLLVQPTDTPQILTFRHRLAQELDYANRAVAVYDRQPMGLVDCSNLVQILRDICQDGQCLLRLTSRHSEKVFWYLAGMNASEKAITLYKATSSLLPEDASSPAHRPNLKPQLQLFRMETARHVAGHVFAFMPGLR